MSRKIPMMPLAADVRGDLMRFSMGAPTINREDILDLCDQFDALSIDVVHLRAENRRLQAELEAWKTRAIQVEAKLRGRADLKLVRPKCRSRDD